MTSLKKKLFNRFNDWIVGHIKGIGYEWITVSIIELLNSKGILEKSIALQSWTYFKEIMDWVWYINTVFFNCRLEICPPLDSSQEIKTEFSCQEDCLEQGS